MKNIQIIKNPIQPSSNLHKKDKKDQKQLRNQYDKNKDKDDKRQQKNITKTIQLNKTHRLNGNITSKPQDKYDYMIKFILVGDSGVGKTNIIEAFCSQKSYKNQIQNNSTLKNMSHIPTIGVDFSTKIIQIQNKRVKLQIWDTAGQERFKTITQTYYRGAAGIILVYSVGNQSSFRSIQKWLSQISQKAPKHVKKILVANKIDLPQVIKQENCQKQLQKLSKIDQIEQKARVVSKKRGIKLAGQHSIQYFQVSARKNQRVDQIFYHLSLQVKKQLQAEHLNDNQSDNEEIENVRITLEDNNKSISRQRRKRNGIQFEQNQKQIKIDSKWRISKCNC